MEKLFAVIVFMLLIQSGKGQKLDEWFQQKKTQKKYLLQQIASLQQYAGYIKKGIDIAKSGLQTIGDIKKGDFNLHNNFFNSLKAINPAIKDYAKIAVIIEIQVNIVKARNKVYKLVKASNGFTVSEMDYINKVFKDMLSKTVDKINELIAVTSTGKLELKDDERLQSIDELYADMQDRFSFTQHFINQITTLSVNRLRQKTDIKTGRLLHGIK